jgi:protein tyrosine phosphatase type IVA
MEPRLPNAPAFIDCTWNNGCKIKFMIMDAPSDVNVHIYGQVLKRHGVSDVVRVCDPTYSKEKLEREGIQLHDMGFEDGEAPPASALQQWLQLVDLRCRESQAAGKTATIAVHCVAGLGRAPVLVAVALIESGKTAEDAVEMIRSKRRGAINNKQLKFLQSYKVSMCTGVLCASRCVTDSMWQCAASEQAGRRMCSHVKSSDRVLKWGKEGHEASLHTQNKGNADCGQSSE